MTRAVSFASTPAPRETVALVAADTTDPRVVEGRRLARNWDLDPPLRSHTVRQLAEHLVDVRATCRTNDGRVDWGGRSEEYRRLHREIVAASEDPKGLATSLRPHVGNVLREKLTADQLAEYGMKPSSPNERQRERQRELRIAPPSGDAATEVLAFHSLLKDGSLMTDAQAWPSRRRLRVARDLREISELAVEQADGIANIG